VSGTGTSLRIGWLLLLLAPCLVAQERKIDATWLHRYAPDAKPFRTKFTNDSCVYKPLFGEGDAQERGLRSVSRFGQIEIAKGGRCEPVSYSREEEIYFVLSGQGTLEYGTEQHALRKFDFTYLPPGVRRSIASGSNDSLKVLVMGFQIPEKVVLTPPPAQPKIVNLEGVEEQTVGGHPSSVLYRLLIGPRGAKRDAIDDAYVITSLFWMDFAPGGTNFPHHHETAEEIYLLLEGNGDIVAGSGLDGVEARFPAKPGDAYYFRPNCTVGFYNQNKPGAKAYILAVRSRIPLSDEVD